VCAETSAVDVETIDVFPVLGWYEQRVDGRIGAAELSVTHDPLPPSGRENDRRLLRHDDESDRLML
jgi:hypothetical protein